MARFEVHYSFTCRNCNHANDNRIVITAPDTIAARDFTVVSSECSECKTPVDPEKPFDANVKQL
jgi:hypothetical protein